MTDGPLFSSQLVVSVHKHNLSDADVCTFARVSTGAAGGLAEKDRGLIHALMRERHGTPFEHGSITFLLDVPGVVVWQLVRHRAGVSFSVESGRYRELPPEFYLPPSQRPLRQVGKPMDYAMLPGSADDVAYLCSELEDACVEGHARYRRLLEFGFAREVARLALPTWLQYWNLYVTFNPRSLMHFLSLRTTSEHASYASKPQWEIAKTAELMEESWARLMPVTHEAFTLYGRVSP